MRYWSICLVAFFLQLCRAQPGCQEVLRHLGYPCRCSTLHDGEMSLDCDKVVLPGDFPALPFQADLVAFSQRSAGNQGIPTQAFVQAGLPLRKLDFTDNSIRRLNERVFAGLKSTLQELRLGQNLLGDSLNPIFSTTEFHGLGQLKILDLRYNHIKALEEGLLKGCDNLLEFWLDGNSLTEVPSSSLNGPKVLRLLSLRNNRISIIKDGAFVAQQRMERLDLSGNRITVIEEGAFSGLSTLRQLDLAHNKLIKLNSDVFIGAESVQELDMSENFLLEFPTISLKQFTSLTFLNLSSNLIEKLDNANLASVPDLELLDLSRNNIGNIAPGTFLGLRHLRHLDLSVNTLRTVEDDAFEGLNKLETLSLQDNNILLVPASALGRLPRLTRLELDFNRVAALGSDILRAVADRVTSLSLARNVVRELPSDAFQDFKKLKSLDLSGNLLLSIEMSSFTGLEETLEVLDLRGNRLSSLPSKPLTLLHLQKLDLSHNHVTELARTSFLMVPALLNLNLSYNLQLGSIPSTIFQSLTHLEMLDLSHTALKVLSPELLLKTTSLRWLSFSHNSLQELTESAFQNLKNLTVLDLSRNHITNIRPGCFASLSSLRRLDLSGNKLTSFKGEFFVTRRSNGTQLEELNLSDNDLSYLFPSSFRVHPRLKKISASRNRFSFFPAELIVSLNYLQEVDLGENMLKSLEEFDFGRLPRLQVLKFNKNQLDSISETAFHNSTQLQIIDLSGNALERLGERTFQGLGRLKLLDLKDNLLSELPDSIFERSRLRMLENVDLSGNLFELPPLKALQKQYFFLMSVNLSKNKLKEIPPDDSIMVNIKRLDLSFNPLTPESISNVLGEPKTVRELNLAGTGITHITRLETPFLHHLNLSFNEISDIPEKVFERPTLLEVIDLSHNKIGDISGTLSQVWGKLKNLHTVDLSSNPIKNIIQGDLNGLESLRKLNISNLEECTRIEKVAFKNLGNLAELEAYGYPRLGYLDVTGLLHSLPTLEVLDVEVKDSAVGSEQLSAAMNPRLAKLGIRGRRVRSISSSALAGLKSPEITVELRGTSLNILPPALLIPLPRSSKVKLDVSDSLLSTLTTQFLTALDDRRGDLTLIGLDSNPISCDCNARALRRSGLGSKIICSSPPHLEGKLLVEIADDELTCDPHRPTTSTTEPPSTYRTSRITMRTTEPDIIWSVAPPTTTHRMPTKTLMGATMINNDDTLIISIVGGVVAFIAVLIIIICIVRLRWTDNPYPGNPMGPVPPMMPHCNNPGCPCPKLPPMLPIGTPYGPTYATLPSKRHAPNSISPPLRASYSTLGRAHYPPNQPFYIAYPPGDEKDHNAR
ncbi:chaoptin [Cimex lectularius]|uniref:Chaoptin n=1 Tax=Cimex lectularius TaxID=79782 RepID=A0A8I6RVR3_CIMLE|nr:chaoptin [Cimex lectularius]